MSQNTDQAGSAIEAHPRPRFVSDHLSNERTYLSYLRTAVSLMGFGIAINRFSLFLAQSNSSRVSSSTVNSERIGIGMVGLGMALLIWATVHYGQIFRQIERQDFRARPGSILILSGLVLVFGFGSVIWLFLG